MSLEGSKQKITLLVVAVWVLFTIAGSIFSGARVSAYNDDYPAIWRGSMDSMLDSWGYYNRECTSFVAWRLHNQNGFEMPWAIGNASNWGTWANTHGYTVNMSPAVGSVAWFSSHVAWVEAVNGGTITIEDYNGVDSNHDGMYGNDGTYSERNIQANSVNGYIHFRDLSGSQASGLGVSTFTFMGSNQLGVNQVLQANQYILSDDARFFLLMQGDGNLVVYGPGYQPYWSSRTVGSGAAYAVMQSDGNLVLYRSDNTPVWSSRTANRGPSKLYMQSDGNLVIYNDNGATWASNTGGHLAFEPYGATVLNANQTLSSNRYLRSQNRKYVIVLQADGNLVLYSPGYHVLWNSGTYGRGATHAVMQSDGNFVLYTDSSRPVWSSNTWGKGLSFATMQDDGNFVVYTFSGAATWSTGTWGQI